MNTLQPRLWYIFITCKSYHQRTNDGLYLGYKCATVFYHYYTRVICHAPRKAIHRWDAVTRSTAYRSSKFSLSPDQNRCRHRVSFQLLQRRFQSVKVTLYGILIVDFLINRQLIICRQFNHYRAGFEDDRGFGDIYRYRAFRF